MSHSQTFAMRIPMASGTRKPETLAYTEKRDGSRPYARLDFRNEDKQRKDLVLKARNYDGNGSGTEISQRRVVWFPPSLMQSGTLGGEDV